jgi:hypothetical protein|tara:strand:+ start:307 stop:687 length:381 start_codon:yes stop_codon:yes gene_type:complete
VVFSIIDDKDELIEKVVNCNNCGVSHNIVGLCQSNVIEGKELSKAAMTIEDITIMLPDGVVSILKSYEKTLPDYEHVKFIIDNERAGEFISLTSEVIEDKKAGKVLHYQGLGKFIIEPYQVDEMIK